MRVLNRARRAIVNRGNEVSPPGYQTYVRETNSGCIAQLFVHPCPSFAFVHSFARFQS